jgi:hypothetical protein
MTVAPSDRENLRPILATKEAYRRPELVQYGTLRELTLMINFSGQPDGADCEISDRHCKTS